MSVAAKQKNLRITLETKIDLTTATNLKILWVDPTGKKGSWNATLTGTTQIYYDMQLTDNIVVGGYSLQSYAEIGGKSTYGAVVPYNFLESLD